MKILEYCLNTGKTKENCNLWIRTEKQGNITSVFIDGFSQYSLNADLGAEITFCINDIANWTAIYRNCEWWCEPCWGTAEKDIPDETQCLIYKKNDGTFGVILPVVSEEYKCVLCGTENGIRANLFSWCDKLNSCHALAFMHAEGQNPFELIKNCTEKALSILDTGYRMRNNRTYPSHLEHLGWCSWDAFHIWVNEEGLLNKAKEFKEKNIPVNWVMIDDMWAEIRDFYNHTPDDGVPLWKYLHASSLYSFSADPKRFPNGLKHCIDLLKEHGLTVGVWHPTTGYWKGIDRNGEAYKLLKDYLSEAPDGTLVPDYHKEKSYIYYSTLHDYLRKCGAEIVKIDNQSISRRYYKGLAPVGKVVRDFHDAMEASAAEHFGSQVINCMGMAGEDVWNRSISPISRCSNDFQPENPEWFADHITQCAYNSIYLGQFYYCDWDMWWTDDSQALKNSILRAISGGPIYISDELDRSNKDLLMPLILSDGKILRCDRPAMPTKDCLTENPRKSKKPFKLQNVCDGSGILAVFNISDDWNENVCGEISPSDIEGLSGENFAVYEHFSKELKILKYSQSLKTELNGKDDFRLYIIVPIRDGFAPIGRIDKFISPKTIKCIYNKQIILLEDGPYAYVQDGQLYIK